MLLSTQSSLSPFMGLTMGRPDDHPITAVNAELTV